MATVCSSQRLGPSCSPIDTKLRSVQARVLRVKSPRGLTASLVLASVTFMGMHLPCQQQAGFAVMCSHPSTYSGMEASEGFWGKTQLAFLCNETYIRPQASFLGIEK